MRNRNTTIGIYILAILPMRARDSAAKMRKEMKPEKKIGKRGNENAASQAAKKLVGATAALPQ